MRLVLDKKEQMLLDQLLKVPPGYDKAENFIQQNGISDESVTKVAICYAEACFGECGDDFNSHLGFHSSYILDVVKLLLKYGLNPNAVFQTEHGNYNIMREVSWIDNGYLGVDALAKLLEHGGDPNLSIDGETLFEQVCFDIWFGSIEQKQRWLYDIWVHMWMVLAGYGGSEEGDKLKLLLVWDEDFECEEPFEVSRLKHHNDFYFGLSRENGVRMLCIYDKKTFWKVAEWG